VEAEDVRPIRLLAVIEATSITGPAKNLLQFAELAHPRVQVSIVTFARTGDSPRFLHAAQALGIPVETIAESGRFDRHVTERLRSVVIAARPDLIQTHAVKSHFLARRAGLAAVAAWIAFHHGYTWPNLRVRFYNQLDRWSLRSARQIVTVSQSFRQQLQDLGIPAQRIEVLSNAINPEWGSKARQEARALKDQWKIERAKPVILIVGRLSAEKDHLTLLEALARIHQGNRNAPHLMIVGEGLGRPLIEARIRALHLESHVTLTGHVDSAEPFYGWADIAVLSSLSEGSPNALLEAMAARVPLVATSVGGIPEMVANRVSALLVSPGNSPALAAALEEVLTNPNLAAQLSRAARELVETRFSPSLRVAQLEQIYQRVLFR
jgi:glycosyltransferase involved in cell wall biosynthesis